MLARFNREPMFQSDIIPNMAGLYNPRFGRPFKEYVQEDIDGYSAEVAFLKQQLELLKEACKGFKVPQFSLSGTWGVTSGGHTVTTPLTVVVDDGLLCQDIDGWKLLANVTDKLGIVTDGRWIGVQGAIIEFGLRRRV